MAHIKRKLLLGACGMILAGHELLAQTSTTPLAVTPSTADANERLKKLPAAEKQELKHKQERFTKLPETEQERLRELHTQVSSSADSKRLEATIAAYHSWLKTLSAAEQAELDSLSDAEKVKKIRQIKEVQRKTKYREYIGELVSTLPAGDLKLIFDWLDKHFEQVQKDFMAKAPPDFRKMAEKNSTPLQQRRFLMTMLALRPSNDRSFQFPGMEAPVLPIKDFDTLLPSLSKDTQKLFEKNKEGDPQRRELILAMIRAAVISKELPPLNDDDLRKLYGSLPAEEQERLQTLTPEAMKRELQLKFYFQARHGGRDFRGPGGGERGPFPRGEGPGRGGPGRGGPDHEGPPGDRNGPPREGGRPEGSPEFRGPDGPFRGPPRGTKGRPGIPENGEDGPMPPPPSKEPPAEAAK